MRFSSESFWCWQVIGLATRWECTQRSRRIRKKNMSGLLVSHHVHLPCRNCVLDTLSSWYIRLYVRHLAKKGLFWACTSYSNWLLAMVSQYHASLDWKKKYNYTWVPYSDITSHAFDSLSKVSIPPHLNILVSHGIAMIEEWLESNFKWPAWCLSVEFVLPQDQAWSSL